MPSRSASSSGRSAHSGGGEGGGEGGGDDDSTRMKLVLVDDGAVDEGATMMLTSLAARDGSPVRQHGRVSEALGPDHRDLPEDPVHDPGQPSATPGHHARHAGRQPADAEHLVSTTGRRIERIFRIAVWLMFLGG